MGKLSLKQIDAFVKDYVASAKIANPSFTATAENIAGLVDKIGKQVNYDTVYSDKLRMLNGDVLPYGKTVEEWAMNLTMPEKYDAEGAGALSPADPTFMKPCYSYSLGRIKFKTTIRNDNLERAMLNGDEFGSIVAQITKKLVDSVAVEMYAEKRQLLGELGAECAKTIAASSTFGVYSNATAYEVGTQLKNTASATKTGIVVKKKSTASLTWDEAVAQGFIVEYDNMVQTLAVPTDTATGEAFVKQVKSDVEIASDISEGHSLNGNTLGATEGLYLFVKQGVIPAVEVNVMAGAFHEDKMAVPAEIVVIKDFGTKAPAGTYAILADIRGIRSFIGYDAVREQLNADGDFTNIFRHIEPTVSYSRNTFVKVYKNA